MSRKPHDHPPHRYADINIATKQQELSSPDSSEVVTQHNESVDTSIIPRLESSEKGTIQEFAQTDTDARHDLAINTNIGGHERFISSSGDLKSSGSSFQHESTALVAQPQFQNPSQPQTQTVPTAPIPSASLVSPTKYLPIMIPPGWTLKDLTVCFRCFKKHKVCGRTGTCMTCVHHPKSGCSMSGRPFLFLQIAVLLSGDNGEQFRDALLDVRPGYPIYVDELRISAGSNAGAFTIRGLQNRVQRWLKTTLDHAGLSSDSWDHCSIMSTTATGAQTSFPTIRTDDSLQTAIAAIVATFDGKELYRPTKEFCPGDKSCPTLTSVFRCSEDADLRSIVYADGPFVAHGLSDKKIMNSFVDAFRTLVALGNRQPMRLAPNTPVTATGSVLPTMGSSQFQAAAFSASVDQAASTSGSLYTTHTAAAHAGKASSGNSGGGDPNGRASVPSSSRPGISTVRSSAPRTPLTDITRSFNHVPAPRPPTRLSTNPYLATNEKKRAVPPGQENLPTAKRLKASTANLSLWSTESRGPVPHPGSFPPFISPNVGPSRHLGDYATSGLDSANTYGNSLLPPLPASAHPRAFSGAGVSPYYGSYVAPALDPAIGYYGAAPASAFLRTRLGASANVASPYYNDYLTPGFVPAHAYLSSPAAASFRDQIPPRVPPTDFSIYQDNADDTFAYNGSSSLRRHGSQAPTNQNYQNVDWGYSAMRSAYVPGSMRVTHYTNAMRPEPDTRPPLIRQPRVPRAMGATEYTGQDQPEPAAQPSAIRPPIMQAQPVRPPPLTSRGTSTRRPISRIPKVRSGKTVETAIVISDDEED